MKRDGKAMQTDEVMRAMGCSWRASADAPPSGSCVAMQDPLRQEARQVLLNMHAKREGKAMETDEVMRARCNGWRASADASPSCS